MENKKCCRKCGKTKPAEDFYQHPNMKDGRLHHCKPCHLLMNAACRAKKPKQYNEASRKYQRDWRKKNPESYAAARKKFNEKNRDKILKSKKEARLWKQYGMTTARYDQMVKEQGGLCLVCGDPPRGRFKKLHIDHCHKTGKVRGLLCVGCNRAAGYLSDDHIRARSLADYLEHHQSALLPWR